jgi:hypothetical protein
MKKLFFSALTASAIILTTACSKDDDIIVNAPTITTKIDSINVNFSNTAAFVFFSLKNGSVIANTDSATTKWDFAMRRTTFLVNSASSGPGNAGAILQDALYNAVTAAPATGYAVDTSASARAIKDGSWYNYNPTTRIFTPKAGKTFIFRTAEGKFAKMELLATDYLPFVGQFPDKIKYKFTYTYQDNGSTQF